MIVIISAIFLITATLKILDFQGSSNLIQALGVSPYFSDLFVVLIIGYELTLSCLVHIKRITYYVLLLLLIIPLVGIFIDIYLFAFGIADNCGCFGALLSDESIFTSIIIKFIVLTIISYSAYKQKK